MKYAYLLTIGLFISSLCNSKSNCIDISPAMQEKLKHLPELEDRALIFKQTGMNNCTKLNLDGGKNWATFFEILSKDPAQNIAEIKKRFVNADPDRIYMCTNNEGKQLLIALPPRQRN